MSRRAKPRLFMRNSDYSPMVFCVPNKEQRFDIEDFINKNGGTIVTKGDGIGLDSAIFLCEPDSVIRPSDVDVFSTNYIKDCELGNKLLKDLKNYRLNKQSVIIDDYNPLDIMMGDLKWSQLAVKKKYNLGEMVEANGLEVSDIEEEAEEIAKSPKKTLNKTTLSNYVAPLKMAYTFKEEEAIVKFIVKNKAYSQVRGNNLWKKMASETSTHRSWQSLREHFLKSIALKLFRFGLGEKEKNNMKKGLKGQLVEATSSDESDGVPGNSAPKKSDSKSAYRSINKTSLKTPSRTPSPRKSILIGESSEKASSPDKTTSPKKPIIRTTQSPKKAHMVSFDDPDATTDFEEPEKQSQSVLTPDPSKENHELKENRVKDPFSCRVLLEKIVARDSRLNRVNGDNKPETDAKNTTELEETQSGSENDDSEELSDYSDEEDSGSRYTHNEDKQILQFIIKTRNYNLVRGNKIYVLMQKRLKKRRSHHSLRNRFLRNIYPNLDSYKIHKEHYIRLKEAMGDAEKRATASDFYKRLLLSPLPDFDDDDDKESLPKKRRVVKEHQVSSASGSSPVVKKRRLFTQKGVMLETPTVMKTPARPVLSPELPRRKPAGKTKSPNVESEKPQNTTLPAVSHRDPFSRQEDEEILKYIVKKNCHSEVKGIHLWKQIEMKNVCPGRTAQSLKERFRKRIMAKIDGFDKIIPQEDIEALKKYSSVTKKR